MRAVALIALLALATAAGPDVARREEAYRANNLGVALLEQFRHEEAAGAFRRALGIDPTLELARINLAIALLNVPQLPESRAAAREAVSASPRSPHAHYALALAARGLGENAEAESSLRRVLELDPADVGAHVNFGQLLMQQRQYEPAIAEFRAALATESFNATAMYNLGLALARTGRAEESRAAMERFQRLREGGYGTVLAQAYPEQGRYAEAIASTGAEPTLVDPATPPARFVDVTAKMLPTADQKAQAAHASPGRVALFDLDGDGTLEVFNVGGEGQKLFRREGGRLIDVTTAWGLDRTEGGHGAVAGDYDNDERADLLVLRAAGPAFLHNDGGKLSDWTERTGMAGLSPVSVAALADMDHDGDLDALFAGGSTAAPLRLMQNDGTGRSRDVAATAGLSPVSGAILALVPSDVDNRRDVDLVVVAQGAPVQLFRNRRDGTFAEGAGTAGLKSEADRRCAAAGDYDKDGFVDVFFCVAGGPGTLARNDGKGAFRVEPAPSATADATAAVFADYDADGLLDLLVVARGGLRVLRQVGGGRFDDVTAAAVAKDVPGDLASLAAGDLDGDGDTDLAVRRTGGALHLLDNQGGRHRGLRVRLAGLVSNRSGVGAKVEMRAGSLHQKLETYAATPAPGPADVVFGLGARPAADAVRVLWPAGILQTELVSGPLAAMAVKELDRKPSSCPYLYAWNGRAFRFITDFMGGGEMGYWHGPGHYNTPDPDEYVRIRDDQLVAREGRLELRVTNELEEALFLDRFELVAVAHPAGVEIHPDEGLRSTPPAFRLFAARDLHAPLRATDGLGRDVTDRLRDVDRRFVDGFALHRIRGYAAPHTLTLDLGPGAGDGTLLLLTGWTDYAFSSDNVAAHQAGLAMSPPRLEVQDEAGRWVTAQEEVGIPVGRPQTLVVDMTGKWRGPRRLVRLVTNMRIYWDQARVATAARPPEARGLVRLPALQADLRERGFSAEVSPDGRGPFGYDYARVSAASPWKAFPGRYTRTGDVRELVAATDDMFVLSRPGDEIALAFDATALPPLPAGWRRTYFLYGDGYSKEMDLHSATPDTLGPLPYHGMPSYPYAPPAAYPLTPERRAALERYNTRVVRMPVASIDVVMAQESGR